MMLRHATLITVSFAALAAGCTIAEQEGRYRDFFAETAQAHVLGYRLPDESQYGPAWAFVEGQGWQTRDGSGETKAEFWTSGEFNGDETIDYAYILVEESTRTRTLFAFVSTPSGYEVERLDAGFEWGIWLRTREPGRYETVPAPAGNLEVPLNVLEFDARNQAIVFFEFDGISSSFVWNATTQSFDRFWTSE